MARDAAHAVGAVAPRRRALDEGKRDAVLLALRDQEEAGIDIVTDGEQTRRHFVWGFVEQLDGIDFSQMVTIGIRADRYKADGADGDRTGAPPRPDPRATRCASRAADTARRLKLDHPGADDHRRHHPRRALRQPRAGSAWSWPALINEEARELEALGVDVIQLDEPAFNVYMDEVRDWGIAALDRAVEGLRCRTAVHICYGYGIKANTDWKKTLGGEWRQYEQTFPMLPRSHIGGVSLECASSRVPISLIGLLGDKDVLVGAVDVATDDVETPEQVAAVIRAAMAHVPAVAHLPLHQLRHGAALARGGAREAAGARRGRGARAAASSRSRPARSADRPGQGGP